MKIKTYLKYLFIFLIILILLVTNTLITSHYNQITLRTFTIKPNLYLFQLFTNICTGLALGFDEFLHEYRKEGMLRINTPKFLCLGLPSLYFSLTNVAMLSNIQFIQENIYYFSNPILNSSNTVVIFQVVFGYSIITSIYKK